MKISGIYLIINTVNDKIYVGSAADILKRWTWHRRRLEIGKHHNQLLQRSYNKHGDVFHYCIVEECLIDNLFEIEQLWLDRTDCCNPEHGYNIYKTAGSPRGRKHTDEWKINNGNKSRGRKLSEETKEKMSDYQNNRSADHKANHAAAMKKRGISPEHKLKLMEANKKRGYKYVEK